MTPQRTHTHTHTHTHTSLQTALSASWDIHPEAELLGCMAVLVLIFEEPPSRFPWWLHQFTLLSKSAQAGQAQRTQHTPYGAPTQETAGTQHPDAHLCGHTQPHGCENVFTWFVTKQEVRWLSQDIWGKCHLRVGHSSGTTALSRPGTRAFHSHPQIEQRLLKNMDGHLPSPSLLPCSYLGV